jgi:hypothetical protein
MRLKFSYGKTIRLRTGDAPTYRRGRLEEDRTTRAGSVLAITRAMSKVA